MAEHVVGNAETLKESRVLGHHQQLFVGNHDHGIDALHQLLQSALGLHQAALALEAKGLGDHGDGQNAHLAGQRGNDRRGAGARAAAQARGDEDHVGAFQRLDDLFRVLERGAAADVGIGTRAQPRGEAHAQLQLDGRLRKLQRLHIGVGSDKLHAFHARLNHAVHGIAAASAHADHLDARAAKGLFVILNPHLSRLALFLFHGGSRLLVCDFQLCQSLFPSP